MQTIAFNDFMSGSYKKESKEVKNKVNVGKVVRRIGTSIAIPLVMAKPAFAASNVEAVPASAKEWMGEQTISALAHALDPLVDVLVALSFPIASVIIVGGCFFFMLGNSEKAWSTIQNAGLGYVLIQISPLILNVLKQIGNAV
ncbi:hypothetical protein M3612_16395 [Niallia taxi]|uniref:hypothetical protein n=1 Tax=Niallia taxi TaxID=2499688 RepID=UPI00203CD4AF|nr:hypothetical protein [Niallia taxi]MCM3216079.1 hypothetical protein [Niallia taxi]